MNNSGLNLRLMEVVLIGLLLPLWTFAQTIAVKDTVLDEFGEPLIGAMVMKKKSANGVATDIDGKLTLNVSPQSKLVVSDHRYRKYHIGRDYDPKAFEYTAKYNTTGVNLFVEEGLTY